MNNVLKQAGKFLLFLAPLILGMLGLWVLAGEPVQDALPEDKMELLAELEHIRWCRYHYLNNWRRGAGQDGRKDPAARLHPDLVPYEALTGESDRDKDRENIRVLLSVEQGT